MSGRLLAPVSGLLGALLLLCAGALPAAAEEARVQNVAVVFVGGYGSNLASATADFGSIQAALIDRGARVSFVQYSYGGWHAPSCGQAQPQYTPDDTAQDIELSKRNLIGTLRMLRSECAASRIVVIGHSLGGLIAFQALADQPVPGVTDIVTIDSPLGGISPEIVWSCVDFGLCIDGPIVAYLANLNSAWSQTELDNAAKAEKLAIAGTRVSAWGNQSDCFYNLAVCAPFVRALFGNVDARETQWLGIPSAIRRDYTSPKRLSSLRISHKVVLSTAALDIALDLLPS
jgi:pimeloyl-ACP methyl ester carboxylesterase